jgi:hypothetical protein
MTIRPGDKAEWCLDCWPDAEPPDDAEPLCWSSDDRNEMVIEADRLIEAGEFRLIELCQRDNSQPDRWRRITRFTVAPQPP